MKLDGWTLRNGVTTNKKHPKTLHIPTEKERTNLVSSDLAKLGFEVVDRHDGDTYGERMWVEVSGKVGPYYVGSLRNIPLPPHRHVKWGGPVVFLPEHVIDIVPAKKPAARKRKHAKKPAARKPSR
jgi:hypothetical protein